MCRASPGSAAEVQCGWVYVVNRKLALFEHRLRPATHRLEPLTAAATNHNHSGKLDQTIRYEAVV